MAEFLPKPSAAVSIISFDRPKPKQSVRAGTANMYPDKDVVRAENALRQRIKDEMEKLRIDQPFLGEVKLEAVFLLPYASKEEAAWADAGHVPQMAATPDVDNLVKLVCDAAKGPQGLFLDDCQVAAQSVLKLYNVWTGFWVRFTCRDPEHPAQLAKRVAAWQRALKAVEKKRGERNERQQKRRQALKKQAAEAAALQRERLAGGIG